MFKIESRVQSCFVPHEGRSVQYQLLLLSSHISSRLLFPSLIELIRQMTESSIVFLTDSLLFP